MPDLSLDRPLNIVAVSGSVQSPSKTTVLVNEILAAFGREVPILGHTVELYNLGPTFAGSLRRDQLPAAAKAELDQIEEADLLVAASPVYRASFTGLFKHLFDFVGQYALIDKPVLLAATGGSDRHALAIEHQFRPLFGFFQALTLPLGIYAKDSDFTNYRISNPDLQHRIELAVTRALPLVTLDLAHAEVVG